MTGQNRVLVYRHFDELWNQGDLLVADEIYAARYAQHLLSAGTAHGPESEKTLVVRVRTSVSGLAFTIDDLIAAGDRVVVRWTLRGMATGGEPARPAPPREIAVPGIRIFRLAGGKIVESWDTLDLAALLVADAAIR
jgi:predicted ester cyclase